MISAPLFATLIFFFNEISGIVRVTREQRDRENLGRLPEKKG